MSVPDGTCAASGGSRCCAYCILCRRNALVEAVQNGFAQYEQPSREALSNDLQHYVDAARQALGPPLLKVRRAYARASGLCVSLRGREHYLVLDSVLDASQRQIAVVQFAGALLILAMALLTWCRWRGRTVGTHALLGTRR